MRSLLGYLVLGMSLWTVTQALEVVIVMTTGPDS